LNDAAWLTETRIIIPGRFSINLSDGVELARTYVISDVPCAYPINLAEVVFRLEKYVEAGRNGV
jgi:hypothetical protein